MTGLPVVVIGAGPQGLAAAAHLLERGLEPLVLEAGDGSGCGGAGVVACAVVLAVAGAGRRRGRAAVGADGLACADVGVSDRWCVDRAVPGPARRQCWVIGSGTAPGWSGCPAVAGTGWFLPGGRISRSPCWWPARMVSTGSRPGRWSTRPAPGAGRDRPVPTGCRRSGRPRPPTSVWSATGHPRRPRRLTLAGGHVVVVGSGHSAMTAVIDLAGSVRLTWVLRRGQVGDTFGGGASDALPQRGALGQRAKAAVDAGQVRLVTGFRTEAIEVTDAGVVLVGEDGRRLEPADQVVVLTGFRPDLSFLSEMRLDLDPVLQAPRRAGRRDRPERALLRSVRPARGRVSWPNPSRGSTWSG